MIIKIDYIFMKYQLKISNNINIVKSAFFRLSTKSLQIKQLRFSRYFAKFKTLSRDLF
jgi:hypothetical protein